jgi:type IV secretion system protein VirD4
LLDELANIGTIPNFDKLIATIRSREISACVILQTQSQLKNMYKDNAETNIGNMDSRVFLGGSEKTTLKDLSESLGKDTNDLLNHSVSKGNSPSFSQNYQKLGKELMSVDEVAASPGFDGGIVTVASLTSYVTANICEVTAFSLLTRSALLAPFCPMLTEYAARM